MTAMEVIVLWIAGAIISYILLYMVIRTAVRDAIIDARNTGDIQNRTRYTYEDIDDDEGDQISKVSCPSCKKKHDMDYPACPYCKHPYI